MINERGCRQKGEGVHKITKGEEVIEKAKQGGSLFSRGEAQNARPAREDPTNGASYAKLKARRERTMVVAPILHK